MTTFLEVCEAKNQAGIAKLYAQQITARMGKSALDHTLSKRAWIEADRLAHNAAAVNYRYEQSQ
jgi:hypothetical protein